MKVSTVGKTLADFPELVEQIDEDTHSDLDVQTITAGTNKKLKWVCDKGPDHKWEAAVWSRTGRGAGCPFCSGRALSITNCLETRYPEVAKQWHPTRNEDKTPKDFTYSSNKKVWWLCPDCGDDWKAQITNRTLILQREGEAVMRGRFSIAHDAILRDFNRCVVRCIVRRNVFERCIV